jgi:hypothetical protein
MATIINYQILGGGRRKLHTYCKNMHFWIVHGNKYAVCSADFLVLNYDVILYILHSSIYLFPAAWGQLAPLFFEDIKLNRA